MRFIVESIAECQHHQHSFSIIFSDRCHLRGARKKKRIKSKWIDVDTDGLYNSICSGPSIYIYRHLYALRS